MGWSWLGEWKKAFPAGEFGGQVNEYQQSQKVGKVCRKRRTRLYVVWWCISSRDGWTRVKKGRKQLAWSVDGCSCCFAKDDSGNCALVCTRWWNVSFLINLLLEQSGMSEFGEALALCWHWGHVLEEVIFTLTAPFTWGQCLWAAASPELLVSLLWWSSWSPGLFWSQSWCWIEAEGWPGTRRWHGPWLWMPSVYHVGQGLWIAVFSH